MNLVSPVKDWRYDLTSDRRTGLNTPLSVLIVPVRDSDGVCIGVFEAWNKVTDKVEGVEGMCVCVCVLCVCMCVCVLHYSTTVITRWHAHLN